MAVHEVMQQRKERRQKQAHATASGTVAIEFVNPAHPKAPSDDEEETGDGEEANSTSDAEKDDDK